MGMYTEIVVKARIKRDAPPGVHDVLNYLFNEEEEPSEKPDHPLFKKPRWFSIGGCCSYYHVPFTASRYSEGYLFSRSDIKNYDGEIEAFFDWLVPYVDAEAGQCIGWSWYEEADVPTLVVVGGTKEAPDA